METRDRRNWPFQIGREAGMTRRSSVQYAASTPHAAPRSGFRMRLGNAGGPPAMGGATARRAKMQLARLVLDRMRAEEIGPAPSLAFSSDDDPGWRRRRHGAGFSYG